MNIQKFNANAFIGCTSLNKTAAKTCNKKVSTRICLKPYKKHTRTKRMYPIELLETVHIYRKDGHPFSSIAILLSTSQPYNWRSLADAYRKWQKK